MVAKELDTHQKTFAVEISPPFSAIVQLPKARASTSLSVWLATSLKPLLGPSQYNFPWMCLVGS